MIYKSNFKTINFSTKTKNKLKEYFWKNEWTPFLWNFSRKMLNKLGYNDNVYYSLECQKKQLEHLSTYTYTCPICYSLSNKPIVFNCGHGICESCNKSFTDSKCCICKTHVSTKTKFYM